MEQVISYRSEYKTRGQTLDNAQRRNETESLTQEVLHANPYAIATRTVEAGDGGHRRRVVADPCHVFGLWPQRPQQPGKSGRYRHGQPGTDNCRSCFLPLADVRLVAAADCRKSSREGFARMANDHD